MLARGPGDDGMLARLPGRAGHGPGSEGGRSDLPLRDGADLRGGAGERRIRPAGVHDPDPRLHPVDAARVPQRRRRRPQADDPEPADRGSAEEPLPAALGCSGRPRPRRSPIPARLRRLPRAAGLQLQHRTDRVGVAADSAHRISRLLRPDDAGRLSARDLPGPGGDDDRKLEPARRDRVHPPLLQPGAHRRRRLGDEVGHRPRSQPHRAPGIVARLSDPAAGQIGRRRLLRRVAARLECGRRPSELQRRTGRDRRRGPRVVPGRSKGRVGEDRHPAGPGDARRAESAPRRGAERRGHPARPRPKSPGRSTSVDCSRVGATASTCSGRGSGSTSSWSSRSSPIPNPGA